MRAGVVSVVAGAAIMGAKFVAWWLTGSTVIFADAAESIVNVVAAGLATYSVAVAARPADADHPYGHGKAEALSAAVEGALILAAAGAIVFQALSQLHAGPSVHKIGLGIAVSGAAGLANLGLGLYLIRTGGRQRSEAITADGMHVLADVWSTAAALVALAAVRITGQQWIDPVAGLGVALYILRTGWKVVRRALRTLLDEADFPLIDEIAARIARDRQPHWVEIHELRTWSSGTTHHVDVHLTLPRYLSIEEGHRIGDAFEALLLSSLSGPAEAIVHLDPCTPRQCQGCTMSECPVRAQAPGVPFRIDARSITRAGVL